MNEEHHLQIICCKWFDLQYPQLRPLLHHIRNSSTSAREGAKFKALHCIAGVADLALFVPSQIHHGLFIELKSYKGKQSKAQKDWQKEVEAQGYKYVVVNSFEMFESTIVNYLKKCIAEKNC